MSRQCCKIFAPGQYPQSPNIHSDDIFGYSLAYQELRRARSPHLDRRRAARPALGRVQSSCLPSYATEVDALDEVRAFVCEMQAGTLPELCGDAAP